MSKAYEKLRDEINECFYQIVGIINEIIEHRTNTFSAMLEVGESIQKDSENFVGETEKVVGNISLNINTKIDSLNMEQMRSELQEATKTFLSITEDLELLSYNTICRTMALGEKGSTITHISKEIKKYSTTVKTLLDDITKEFSAVYEKFRYIAENIIKSDISGNSGMLAMDAMEELVISSDVSVLIENSQFHDIFSQELEIINDALNTNEFSDAYEAGMIFGVYEKALNKLDFIKMSLQEKIESIQSVMKDFIYTFNTDLQNIISKTNILREELLRVESISGTICKTIRNLQSSIDESQNVIHKATAGVNNLGKQSKTFKNLVVVTAIEVARINDEDLRSVVISMISTEKELQGLIEKLHFNISLWQKLQNDFMSTFKDAGIELKTICDSSIKSEREKMLRSTYDLEAQLTDFRSVFTGEKYMNYFDSNTRRLLELFSEFVDNTNEEFETFNNKLDDKILSDEMFTQGRNDSELRDILASEDEQSSIEFF